MKQKTMKANHKTLYIALGTLAFGLFLGWIFFGGDATNKTGREVAEGSGTDHRHEANAVWTCSMHPKIRQDGPGPCPICGMDLVPVAGTPVVDTAPEGAVQITTTALRIANVQTVIVGQAEPTRAVYLSGRVEVDERQLGEITARFGGRIEELLVNFTGQEVKRGQALASIYSPELVVAQQELLEAARFRDTHPSFYEAAVNKLKLWDLSDQQIQSILESQEVRHRFSVLASRSGTVVARNVSTGDYVQKGQSLLEVASLDRLWVVFDAYESDLPWIREGDEIRFTVPSLPGQTFTAEVTFVDPAISPQKRVAEVRTEVSNQEGQLKPQMFAQGILESKLPAIDSALVIPKSAVLWTGKRAVVYAKQPGIEPPTFAYREVVLGPEADSYYVISEGLEAGEEIVANGVFKVDAAAQLQGKVSMMNPRNEAEESISEAAVSGISADISPTSVQQLAAVLDSYFGLKNALVASDADAATAAATQTQQTLKAVDMTPLEGQAYRQWMDYLSMMQEALDTIAVATALESQRIAFAPLSQALYQSLRQFDVVSRQAYYQYCPMADRDAGAYWLSESKEIRNPYFGEAMLNCGETRQRLK